MGKEYYFLCEINIKIVWPLFQNADVWNEFVVGTCTKVV